jgi:outer membrane protein assembly factor BamB
VNPTPRHRTLLLSTAKALVLPALLIAAPAAAGAADAVAPRAKQAAREMTTGWPQFQRGPGRHGDNPHETVLNPANVSQIELLWSRSTGPQQPYSLKPSPVVADGLVYVVKSHPRYGSLMALDAASGAVRWSQPIGSTDLCGATPAVADGQVTLPLLDRIAAYDAAGGNLRWRSGRSRGCESSSTPAAVNGKVFAVTVGSSNFLESRNARTGAVLWRRAVCVAGVSCASVIAPAAVANGVVHVADTIGVVFAYSARDGRLLWSNMAAGRQVTINAAPVVTDEAVYIVASDDRLYALNAKTGSVLWNVLIGIQVSDQAPALSDRTLYLGSFQGLTAVDAQTGTVRWHQPAVGKVLTSPAVANGVVYFGAGDDKLYALDSRTGAVLLSRQVTRAEPGLVVLSASPAVVDGVVYVGTQNRLLAFGLPTTPR